MATGNQSEGTYINLLAGASLASDQYKFVKLASTAGEVIVAAAATDNIIGVLQNDPADGQVAQVLVSGWGKVVAEASVSAGAILTSNSTGQAQGTTTGNDTIMGMAVDASTAAGELIRMILSGPSNY